MSEQETFRSLGQPASRLALSGADLPDEVSCQGQNVIETLAQWGDEDGKDREAVEQVLPETFAFHFLVEGSVRCCNDPDIDALRPRSADRQQLTFLEDAKQLGLQGRAGLAHLV